MHPNEKARRRDPRLFEYEPLPCPDDKKVRLVPFVSPKSLSGAVGTVAAARAWAVLHVCAFSEWLNRGKVTEPQQSPQQGGSSGTAERMQVAGCANGEALA